MQEQGEAFIRIIIDCFITILEYNLYLHKTYGIPTIALKCFNVYGSRQALSNPYTGCAAIFTSRILNNKPPHIFEDGNQTRDFIHVKDIGKANLNALEHNNADYKAINIGTGKLSPYTATENKSATSYTST